MKILDEYQGLRYLVMQGLPVVEHRLCTTKKQVLDFADKHQSPLVLKLSSPKLLHKTEADAVRLNLSGSGQVEKAWDVLQENAVKAGLSDSLRGILAQPMIKGHEFIVGGYRDPGFGPVVLFGLGGIYTELLQDTSFRLAPLQARDAEEMIAETRATALLEGFRGEPVLDKSGLVRLIEQVSGVMAETDILELDLNPCFVSTEGIFPVDALVKLP